MKSYDHTHFDVIHVQTPSNDDDSQKILKEDKSSDIFSQQIKNFIDIGKTTKKIHTKNTFGFVMIYNSHRLSLSRRIAVTINVKRLHSNCVPDPKRLFVRKDDGNLLRFAPENMKL